MDLLQLTPISGVGLRTGGDQPNDSYVEVMMQYSDTEGSWKIKKDYRGEMMVCAHISIHNFNYKSKGIICQSEHGVSAERKKSIIRKIQSKLSLFSSIISKLFYYRKKPNMWCLAQCRLNALFLTVAEVEF